MSDYGCRLNRSMQHLLVYWFDNAFAGESSVWGTGPKPKQDSAEGGLTLARDFGFCFQC